MILVDAIYINNSGGKILLDYLIINLEKSNTKILYLLDTRVINKIPSIKNSNDVIFLKNNLFNRHNFYYHNKISFNKILCFGNIPPPLKNKAIVYTYFHQLLFLEKVQKLKYLDKIKLYFKKKYLKFNIDNTNFWIVQSNNVKHKLITEFQNINTNNILILPFYPQIESSNNTTKITNTFFYPSTGYVYKNHFKLITAFVKFFNEYKLGELHLTISNDFPMITDLILNFQVKGYPIINHGFIKRENLFELYSFAEYVIYPSLAESYGISILEAIDFECKVIASDLPYTHSVCKPSIIFNPYSVDSIYEAFVKSTQRGINRSSKLVENNIIPLINILTS